MKMKVKIVVSSNNGKFLDLIISLKEGYFSKMTISYKT